MLSLCLSRASKYLARILPGLTSILLLWILFMNYYGCILLAICLTHVCTVIFTLRACYGTYRAWIGVADMADRKSPTPIGNESTFLIIPKSEIDHIIVIPNYKEPFSVLAETISVLSSHSLARSNYQLVLAMEEAEHGAVEKGNKLIATFGDRFRDIYATFHPSGLPGNAQGKSSNLAWATRIMATKHENTDNKRTVILTVIDSDTHLLDSYFTSINDWINSNHPSFDTYTMFCPPLCFDRNSSQISPFVRAADIMWSIAGFAGLYETSWIRTPTSVYSVTLDLANYVNFWDTGKEAIGEDLHMFIKCFLRTKGSLNQVTIYSPASQCNVAGPSHSYQRSRFSEFMESNYARYKQAIRHMWGSLDSGYFLTEVIKQIHQVFGHNRKEFASTGILDCPITSTDILDYPRKCNKSLSRRSLRYLLLCHRLYEAHFLPAQFFITITLVAFCYFPSYNNNYYIRGVKILEILRPMPLVLTIVQFFLYEKFYSVSVRYRKMSIMHYVNSFENSLDEGGLLENNGGVSSCMEGDNHPVYWLKSIQFSYRSFPTNVIDYLVFPVSGLLYGVLPTFYCQIMHFFTDDLAYTVSSKPPSTIRP